jgi:hypothetical protein
VHERPPSQRHCTSSLTRKDQGPDSVWSCMRQHTCGSGMGQRSIEQPRREGLTEQRGTHAHGDDGVACVLLLAPTLQAVQRPRQLTVVAHVLEAPPPPNAAADTVSSAAAVFAPAPLLLSNENEEEEEVALPMVQLSVGGGGAQGPHMQRELGESADTCGAFCVACAGAPMAAGAGLLGGALTCRETVISTAESKLLTGQLM